MTGNRLPHLRTQGTAQQLIVDGAPFVILAGEIHNSSSSSLAYMEPVWGRLAAMHLNTAIAPVYWELFEPVEGRYEMALLDGLVDGARRHGLRLVLLWFGTWKNAQSSYAPAWVKRDLERFSRLQCTPGRNANALSCMSAAGCEADARAFGALMVRLREIDGRQHTVVMVQVENETGVLGTPRDHHPLAEAAFREPAPAALCSYLRAHREALAPALRQNWEAQGGRDAGTWSEVFGPDADEVFMAWHVARYVDRVAEAGKAAYDLPLAANAWLKGSAEQPAGAYPSGGPVYTMLDVWKAAAPHVDVLAPDIYLPDFSAVCAQYARPDNPLFIPEARRDARAASAALYALAEHDAIGYAPFGIDSVQGPHPLVESYRLLGEMMPLLAECQGRGRMRGVLQQEDEQTWDLALGEVWLHVVAARPLSEGRTPGGALIADLGGDAYLVAGRGVTVAFGTARGREDLEILWLETGRWRERGWTAFRRLNGDETNHGRRARLGDELETVRLQLNRAAGSIDHQEILIWG